MKSHAALQAAKKIALVWLCGGLAGCTGVTAATRALGPSAHPPEARNLGPLGAAYDATDPHGNTYVVKLDKVLRHAAPGSRFDRPSSGDYLVGVEFSISGVKGIASDDSNDDAVIVGSNDEVYQASFGGLAAGSNFDGGTFTVRPGTVETGWVTFELPGVVRPKVVEWETGKPGGGESLASWRA
jgi:hypothetical protein